MTSTDTCSEMNLGPKHGGVAFQIKTHPIIQSQRRLVQIIQFLPDSNLIPVPSPRAPRGPHWSLAFAGAAPPRRQSAESGRRVGGRSAGSVN